MKKFKTILLTLIGAYTSLMQAGACISTGVKCNSELGLAVLEFGQLHRDLLEASTLNQRNGPRQSLLGLIHKNDGPALLEITMWQNLTNRSETYVDSFTELLLIVNIEFRNAIKSVKNNPQTHDFSQLQSAIEALRIFSKADNS